MSNDEKRPLLEVKYRHFSVDNEPKTIDEEQIKMEMLMKAKSLAKQPQPPIDNNQPQILNTRTPIRKLGSRIWQDPDRANYSDGNVIRFPRQIKDQKYSPDADIQRFRLITKRRYQIHEHPTLVLSEASSGQSDDETFDFEPKQSFKYKELIMIKGTIKETFKTTKSDHLPSSQSQTSQKHSTPLKLILEKYVDDDSMKFVTRREYRISEHPTLPLESNSSSDYEYSLDSPAKDSKTDFWTKFQQLSLEKQPQKIDDTFTSIRTADLSQPSSRTKLSIYDNQSSLPGSDQKQTPTMREPDDVITSDHYLPSSSSSTSPSIPTDDGTYHSGSSRSSPNIQRRRVSLLSTYPKALLHGKIRRRRRRLSSKLRGPLANRLARPNRQLHRYIHFEFNAVVNGYRPTRLERRQQQPSTRQMVISKHAVDILNSMAKELIRKFTETADNLLKYSGRKRMNKFVATSTLETMFAFIQHPYPVPVFSEYYQGVAKLEQAKKDKRKNNRKRTTN